MKTPRSPQDEFLEWWSTDEALGRVLEAPKASQGFSRACLVKGRKPKDPIRQSQAPQTQKVLAMLQIGPCTTETFLRAYIGRFGARIAELRAVGWQIKMTKTGEHSARYVLMGRDK